jgi:ATP-dependent 26S proteasome regulatory subunit
MILIIEDIGGGEREQGSRSSVDSGLLNLLDGMSVSFKLPTFIMATTNYPEHLLEALADRPGRFDLMIELTPPNAEERVQLLEFLSKKSLTDDEKKAISSKDADNFSIAHLEEIIVRSMLHKKSIATVIKELVEHTRRFNKEFQKPKNLGI